LDAVEDGGEVLENLFVAEADHTDAVCLQGLGPRRVVVAPGVVDRAVHFHGDPVAAQ